MFLPVPTVAGTALKGSVNVAGHSVLVGRSPGNRGSTCLKFATQVATGWVRFHCPTIPRSNRQSLLWTPPGYRPSASRLGERADALTHVAARLLERQEEIARLITGENGKPIKWARIEVARASSVFRWAAEEVRRWNGEVQRLDTDAATKGRMALVRRVPKGPVLAIAPFNFPLNLVAHKLAPAIAVGAPILVKPAPATPMSALLLGELLAETDLPAGMWSVLPVPNDRMSALVKDPRLPLISFTGSATCGLRHQEQCAAQARRAGARRERRRSCPCRLLGRRRSRLGCLPDCDVCQLPGRVSPVSRCSECSLIVPSTTSWWRAW